MKRLFAIAAAVALFCAMTGIAQSAPRESWAQLTTVTSASDGSQWYVVQGDVYQPGGAVWAIDFTDCGLRIVGERGTQTGATWPYTGRVFASADGATLTLPTAVNDALGVAYAPHYAGCDTARLVSYGSKVTVLDPEVVIA